MARKTKTETAKHFRHQQTKPGDWFGECPKCGEMWELKDPADKSDAPDLWECDHCGYKLSIAAAVNAALKAGS